MVQGLLDLRRFGGVALIGLVGYVARGPKEVSLDRWIQRAIPNDSTLLYSEEQGDWFVACGRRESALIVSAWKRESGAAPYRFIVRGIVGDSAVPIAGNGRDFAHNAISNHWLSGEATQGYSITVPIPAFRGKVLVAIELAEGQVRPPVSSDPRYAPEEPELEFNVAFE